MKNRKLKLRNYRILVSRNRKAINNLVGLRNGYSLGYLISNQFKIDYNDGPDFESLERKQSKTQIALSKIMMKLQRKFKGIRDAGLYCVNTFREWLGYTFCCIIIKKKKTPGVLKSVRI